MDEDGRQAYLQKITRTLVIFTGACLGVLLVTFYLILPVFNPNRTYLVSIVFMAGLIGGFVSIQQRLPKIEMKELKSLSGSLSSILLIPVNGGIFAVVLMIMFLSEIMTGPMFPAFRHPELDHGNLVASHVRWFSETFPETGTDIAKLLFWSFVAGFSERFVPQIIRRTQDDAVPK